MMKDSWYDEGCMTLLSLAKKKGVQGVSNVKFVEKASKPLSIPSMRRDHSLEAAGHADRRFSRIITGLHGPVISNFESGLQLVQALRDTIASRLVLAV